VTWYDPVNILNSAKGSNDPAYDHGLYNPDGTIKPRAPKPAAPQGTTYNPSTGTSIYTGGGGQPAPAQATTGSSTAPSFAPPAAAPPTAPPNTTGLQPGQGSPGDVGYNGNVPGAGENVANSYLSYYGQNGTPTTSNRAEEAYQSFNHSTPANMDPYYNNAERNATNDINKQMAARGQFGSSNAVGQISNATTNLRAQQAKDEASYGLQRAGLKGTLGSGADSSSLASSTNDLNWMSGLTGLAFNAQKEGMARYELGNQDAKAAADTASGIIGDNGKASIANDKDLLIQMLMAQYGMSKDAATAAASKASASDAQDSKALNTAVSAGSLFV
jgi:hypothetical protein